MTLFREPNLTSAPMSQLSTGSTLKIINTQGYWVEVEVAGSSLHGWILNTDVRPVEQDMGFLYTFSPTKLLRAAQETAASVTLLPPRTRLTIRKMARDYAQVQYLNFTGFVDLRQVISRLDFADEVLDGIRGWKKVKKRAGPVVYLEDGSLTLLKYIQGFRVHQPMAVILQDEEWPKRSKARVVQRDLEVWAQSDHPDHGQVWWKKRSPWHESLTAPTISGEDLVKRDIAALAFNRANPRMGLVAAQGIFSTTDGQSWTQVARFGSENHPVAVSSKGTYYVGPYLSYDQGQSFWQYIRWDKMAAALQTRLHYPPGQLKLLSLQLVGPKEDRIQVVVDCGHRKLTLQNIIPSQEWSVVP
jgi:SH3-like domain-containing protein